MIIKKILKRRQFYWDFVGRTLEIFDSNVRIQLNKSEMFSLARFILRIAQSGKKRDSAKEVKKNG